MDDFMKLVELCRSKKVYIQTHNFPDPDAIASVYGLQNLLAYYEVPSVLCYYGKIDKLSTRKMTELFNIDIFPYAGLKNDMNAEDYIICVDSQKNGGNILDFEGDEIACIDHHPTYVGGELPVFGHQNRGQLRNPDCRIFPETECFHDGRCGYGTAVRDEDGYGPFHKGCHASGHRYV